MRKDRAAGNTEDSHVYPSYQAKRITPINEFEMAQFACPIYYMREFCGENSGNGTWAQGKAYGRVQEESQRAEACAKRGELNS